MLFDIKVPETKVDAFDEPSVKVPPDKLEPIVIAAVICSALMVFSIKVPSIVVDAFTDPSVKVPPDKFDPIVIAIVGAVV